MGLRRAILLVLLLVLMFVLDSTVQAKHEHEQEYEHELGKESGTADILNHRGAHDCHFSLLMRHPPRDLFKTADPLKL